MFLSKNACLGLTLILLGISFQKARCARQAVIYEVNWAPDFRNFFLLAKWRAIFVFASLNFAFLIISPAWIWSVLPILLGIMAFALHFFYPIV